MPKGKHIAIAAGVLALAVLGVAAWRGWPHLRFWWLFEPLGLNAQGCPEYRHRKTGIVFVSLPGGKFLMGAQKDDPKAPNYDADARPDEGPVHEVELSPFMIGKFEASQAEWERVMGTNPSYFKGAELPVERLSWENCQQFCRKTGLKLPTEAQWEYACRAGTRTPFAFGATIPPREVNYDGDYPFGRRKDLSRGQTVAVTRFEPNGFGLHQVHGNVSEWCRDNHGYGFYSTHEACLKDPVFTEGGWAGPAHVRRGGSWSIGPKRCRSACRYVYVYPLDVTGDLGLRAAFYPLP